MIPRQTEIEAQVLRIARAARNGAEIQPPDASWMRAMWALTKRAGSSVFLLMLGLQALGFRRAELCEPGWQMMAGGLILLFSSGLMTGQIHHLTVTSHQALVCSNLPVSGQTIFTWVRRHVLLRSGCVLLNTLLVSWALHGFAEAQVQHVIITALLLWGTVIVTAIWMVHPIILFLRLGLVWIAMGALCVALCLYLMIFFRQGALPEWLLDLASFSSWLLPATWVMPHRIQSAGLLASMWCLGGAWLWWRWPRREGPLLDAPLPNYGDSSEESLDNDSNADDEEEPRLAAMDESRDLTQKLNFADEQPAFPISGWIERFVRHFLSLRDQQLAAIFMPTGVNWSLAAHVAMTRFMILALAAWVLLSMPALAPWHEKISVWFWGLGVSMLVLGLLPISNMISLATVAFFLGHMRVPALSLLPVSVRDILRISARLTAARTLVFVFVITAAVLLMQVMTSAYIEPLAAAHVWIIPLVLGCFWYLSRPLFICYRLELYLRRPRRGAKLLLYLWTLPLLLLLLLLYAASGMVIMFGIFMLFRLDSGTFYPCAGTLLCGLFMSGMSTRAIFELYHWQLRFGWLEWGTSVVEDRF